MPRRDYSVQPNEVLRKTRLIFRHPARICFPGVNVAGLKRKAGSNVDRKHEHRCTCADAVFAIVSGRAREKFATLCPSRRGSDCHDMAIVGLRSAILRASVSISDRRMRGLGGVYKRTVSKETDREQLRFRSPQIVVERRALCGAPQSGSFRHRDCALDRAVGRVIGGRPTWTRHL
jgi:hypothetical protein